MLRERLDSGFQLGLDVVEPEETHVTVLNLVELIVREIDFLVVVVAHLHLLLANGEQRNGIVAANGTGRSHYVVGPFVFRIKAERGAAGCLETDCGVAAERCTPFVDDVVEVLGKPFEVERREIEIHLAEALGVGRAVAHDFPKA